VRRRSTCSTFPFALAASLLLLDRSRRVDQQQFHRGYTRMAMVMVMGAACFLLTLCGAIGALFFLKR